MCNVHHPSPPSFSYFMLHAGQQGEGHIEDAPEAVKTHTEDKDGRIVIYQQQGLMTTVTTLPIGDEAIRPGNR